MTSYDAYYIAVDTGVISLKLEGIISKSGFYSLSYASDILGGRFELGEKTIMNSYYACDYLVKVMRYDHD